MRAWRGREGGCESMVGGGGGCESLVGGEEGVRAWRGERRRV